MQSEKKDTIRVQIIKLSISQHAHNKYAFNNILHTSKVFIFRIKLNEQQFDETISACEFHSSIVKQGAEMRN